MLVFDPGVASRIVNAAGSVDEFLAAADASDCAFWRASTQQAQTLAAEAQQKDAAANRRPADNTSLTAWVKAYCLKQATTTASKWVYSNVIPASKVDRAGWLAYYLTECTMDRGFMISGGDAQEVDDGLNLLVSKNPEGGVGAMRLKTGRRDGGIDDVPAARLRGVLVRFLRAGFDALPGTVKAFNERDTSRDHLMNFMRKMSGDREAQSFCWRSDSRSMTEIGLDGGFQAKCNSANQETLAKNNMDKDWHPFNLPAIRQYMWFRKGQKDNCLYSVISIGNSEDWKDYLSFPLAADHKSWNMTDRQVSVQRNGRLETVTLGVSWTYLYLFVMSDLILADTEQIQSWIAAEKQRLKEGRSEGGGAFPERATRGIPMENIYGAVKFIRIHHADKATATDDHGFTARPVSYELNYGHALAMKERWGRDFERLENEFQAAFATDVIHRKWTPTGSLNLPEEHRDMKITVASFHQLRVGP